MINEEYNDKNISIKFVQALNRYLPVKRKTLRELLLEERPGVKNLDCSTHYFEKKELERIASMAPERNYSALRLPIYFEMSAAMERGTIKISGRLECMIIQKILYGNEKLLHDMDSMTIYYPHLTKIRKEFPTTTQFMFTI